jgi:hypothetical protein
MILNAMLKGVDDVVDDAALAANVEAGYPPERLDVVGHITIQQIDDIYNRMGLAQLVAIPWYEDGVIVGLVTGHIMPDGEEAQLEHIIILPEAKNRMMVAQLMPATVHEIMRRRGVKRTVVFILKNDARHQGLEAWAIRCGYTKYGESDTKDWYQRSTQ